MTVPPPRVSSIAARWPAILGAVLTIAMTAGLARELLGSGLAGFGRAIPRDPRYYLAFAGVYFTLPLFDYLIFRRLWGLPWHGFAALIAKRIANEVVVGYSGEAYFYAWARSRATSVVAPFAAVKDVTILSAMAGNALTLAMIAAALPAGQALIPAGMTRYVYGSLAVIVGTSLPFVVFSRRVFSLARRRLWWVFGMHLLRAVLASLFLALAWWFALPGVPIAMLLFLGAGRLLFSRLPLLPNKDLLFANFAILAIGREQALSDVIAFTAALILATHAALIVAFGAYRALARWRRRREGAAVPIPVESDVADDGRYPRTAVRK